MKARNWFFLAALFFAIAPVFAAAPATAFASVEITEIMYDLPGTDSGREWVEIQNTAGTALDVSGYKFFEANTNHGLTLLAGSATLAPGSSAVIVQDQAKFLNDYPSFSGTLLKASFDLSNVGETLALKSNSTSTPDDSVTYDASMGASADGNSLQRSGSTFSAATPTPGAYGTSGQSGTPQQSPDTGESTTSSVQTETQTVQNTSSSGPAPVTARITAGATSMVGGGSFFSGQAFGTQGSLLSDVRFIWNFGDGATAEGQSVFHVYSYPGKYALQLTVASSLSAGVARAVVEAVPAQVALLREPDGSLVLLNRSKQNIDVGLWSITSGAGSFVIPQDTTVLGGQSVHFSTTVLQMSAGADAALHYENGALAAGAVGGSVEPAPVKTIPPAHTPPAPAPETPAHIQSAPLPAELSSSTLAPVADIWATTSLSTSEGEVLGVAVETSSPAPDGGVLSPLTESLVGLCALLVLGVAGVLYIRTSTPVPQSVETPSAAEEFEIE